MLLPNQIQMAQKGPEAAAIKSEKSRDIRSTNIIAAQAVADVVRTSLGPRGMDKMVSLTSSFASLHLEAKWNSLEISIPICAL